MLVLQVNLGETIKFIDAANGKELGEITRLKPKPQYPNEVLLGFEFPPEIKILRNSLITGSKDSQDGKKA